MNKTNIEWCDMTWNPVTGCLHGCEYCYARRRTMRMSGFWDGVANTVYGPIISDCVTVCDGLKYRTTKGKMIRAPFPFGFRPALYPYRLNEPTKTKKPQRIFVVSMGDLFGEWVPDEWIKEVFKACEAAPQHTYMFLTKNPNRYVDMQFSLPLPTSNEYWYGFSHTGGELFGLPHGIKRFVSIEPILGEIYASPFVWKEGIDWVVIGAETGNRKSKVVPKRAWIEHIVEQCKLADIPVFMKNSLADIWGEPLIQEWPQARMEL